MSGLRAYLVFGIFLLPAFVPGFGCSKPNVQECEILCTRFRELAFQEQERAKGNTDTGLKKKWKAQKESELFKKGLHNCVNDCRYGGRKSDVPCVVAATSVEEATACTK